MKFSAILSLAFAAVTVAHELSDNNITARDALELDYPVTADDIVMTERDLDVEEGLIEYNEVERRFQPPNIKPVSTTCAANPRRSSSGSNTCGVTGHLKHPTRRTIIHDVIFQRCANSCTCRGESNNNCMAFSWIPNPAEGTGRGRCVMFSETLAEMGFTPGTSRTFYQRSCFHRGKPVQTTGTMTGSKAQATAPSKREIDSGLSEALAGIIKAS